MLKIIVRRWKMPNYLTKEDIKRWRSSLERCTLEQYAEKLGKVIQNEKETCDIIDIVFDKNHEDPFTIKHDDAYTNRYNGEKITSDLNLVNIRKKPLNIVKPESMVNKSSTSKLNSTVQKKELKNQNLNIIKQQPQSNETVILNDISFNKPLTDREQMVFEHFYLHKNTTVFAKDLAEILSLPRDYVYKYIKNLRAKLSRDILVNSEKGGYILKL